MQDPKRQVRKLTKVLTVLELVMDVNQPAAFVQLFISIPGREGTKPYTWLLSPHGVVTTDQWKDMAVVIERELFEGTMSSGGIQGVLPMD